MRIACPHCQTVYEVAAVEPDIGFLCSRCHREFHIGEPATAPDQASGAVPPPDTQLGLFAQSAPEADDAGEHAADSLDVGPPLFLIQEEASETPMGPIVPQAFRHETAAQDAAPVADAAHPAQEELPAPERRAPRLLAWMSAVVLIVAVAGFAYNYRSWSDNLWLRSLLIDLHLPIQVHASDWRIPADSVHAEWLKRDDGTSVLVIEGRVDNLLHAQMATPWIQVTVYDAMHSDKTVKRETLPITQPPAVEAIRHAPWVAPPQDNVPVASAGSRGFMLILDNLPPHAGTFTLKVVPSLFR